MILCSPFDPPVHGFHFSNGTFKVHVGPIACSVLCGGMSYAALDYLKTGILVPESTKAPAEGNPLETYLYRRQETAHFYTWHKFTAAWSTDVPIIGGLLGAAGVGQSSFDELKKWVGGRYPVVICLYGGIGHGHHVIAVAVDDAARSITLYDSNYPNEKPTLTEKNGQWIHSKGSTWKGWFLDWGYYTDGTRQPPVAFRFCGKCKSLHTTRFGQTGTCPAGGTHMINEKFEYFLHWSLSEGQRRWWVCRNCQGAVTDADPQQGKACSVGPGRRHDLRSDELAVKRDSGKGEGNWKACFKCASLYWAGSGNGACAGGGEHDPRYSPNYFLDYRTV